MVKSFNENWLCSKVGEDTAFEVILPHDAMLSEERLPNAKGGKNNGWFVGGDYVYEKKFFAEDNLKDKEVLLEFEGVYKDSKVFINNEYVGGRKYGFLGFYVDIGERLHYGEENTVRVEAFNSEQPNCRWYTGTGIYRPVWLHILPKEHILPNGVKIKTLDHEFPRISVETETSAAGVVNIEIFDGNTSVAEAQIKTCGLCCTEIDIEDGKLWSPENPYLYTAKISFGQDMKEISFGIRTVHCDAKNGLRINGKKTLLLGACVHSDNGLLGACTYRDAEFRKVELLKRVGYNAVRAAHNPCSKYFLEACDKLGMLVVDEYVDMWYIHKLKYDYVNDFTENWEKDISDMVTKDFNHPCVVMYSIGNEVSETAQKRGIELCGAMTEHLHSLDDRPVTCGINIFFNLLSSIGLGVFSDKKANAEQKEKKKKEKLVGSAFFNNLTSLWGAASMKLGATLPGCDSKCKKAFEKLDVAGYNYGIMRYKRDAKKYKDRVILGSETFCIDARRFRVLADKYPSVIGDFVWAGMDYLGEVGIGAWEYADYAPDFDYGAGWLTAGSGRLDITGREWAEAAYTRVAFGLDKIRMGVVRPDKAFEKHTASGWRFSNALESWSYNGTEGKNTKVEVYCLEKTVELFLNGKKIGRKKPNKNGVARFKLRHEKGELMTVCYDKNGNKTGYAFLKSAGDETKLTLVAEREYVKKDGLCYIRIRYTDDKGTIKPLVRGDVKLKVSGGKLVGAGSACPYNPKGYLSDITDTYYGEALAIIRPDKSEKIVLSALSAFGSAEVIVPVK